jgi:hypothetical protein
VLLLRASSTGSFNGGAGKSPPVVKFYSSEGLEMAGWLLASDSGSTGRVDLGACLGLVVWWGFVF